MKLTYVVAIFLFSCNFLSAQIETNWLGGYPGRTKDWNCPYNWSNGKVPNEFNTVYIKAKDFSNQYFPVIYKGNFKIRNLVITHGAKLYIKEQASLTIKNNSLEKDQINRIQNNGRLIFSNPSSFSITLN